MVVFNKLRYSDLIPGEIYEAGSSGGFFADEVISNIFKLDNLKGIGNQGGIRRTMIQNTPSLSREEAFVILMDTQSNPEWPNTYEHSSNQLIYYGDNQDSRKHFLDTKQKGNVALEKYFRRSYTSSTDHIAPFFYFERVNGRDARFIGIAVPFVQDLPVEEALILRQFTKADEGKYENYVARFTILEVPVPRQWLYDLKVGQIESEYIPTVWYHYLQTRKLLSKEESDIVYPN
ncbi:hypothetical protein QWY14_10450 [Planococcus sp. N028]|uniref:Restriction endonuclease AspBHI N-terminal domain-containing protein n=1 Tax=Planococcus shixiaomingii TaxID=3058393 RepID=A0ABT8N2V8_9BACL|nr:hypothetical protein [Planococcus sp. N028]MDN7242221.1 hypothetical protein [Planococcus sp. N028]